MKRRMPAVVLANNGVKLTVDHDVQAFHDFGATLRGLTLISINGRSIQPDLSGYYSSVWPLSTGPINAIFSDGRQHMNVQLTQISYEERLDAQWLVNRTPTGQAVIAEVSTPFGHTIC